MAAYRVHPSDVVRHVGPGIDEALAGLLRYWSRLRTRLKFKGNGKAAPADEPSSTPKEPKSS